MAFEHNAPKCIHVQQLNMCLTAITVFLSQVQLFSQVSVSPIHCNIFQHPHHLFPLQVIQGHRFSGHLKANMQLSISDQ